jgi:protein-tyrosine phosphatase
MSKRKPYRVLMVCMGNICRSPTAEGVLRHRLQAAGLAESVQVDSAGTHSYHIGNPPDERSQAHARRRGDELSGLRARRVCDEDFASFDLILAMDEDNLEWLLAECPPPERGRVGKLVAYARGAPAASSRTRTTAARRTSSACSTSWKTRATGSSST